MKRFGIKSAMLTLLCAMIVSAASAGEPKNLVGACLGPDKWEMAKAAGCDFIEGSVPKVLMPENSDAEFAAALAGYKASGAKIYALNGFLIPDIKVTGPNADHKRALKWAETAFSRAKQMGIKVIVFGSGRSRGIEGNFPYDKAMEQFKSLLAQMGPIAKKYDVVVAVESLNSKEVNFLCKFSEATALVKAVNHPNIKLVCDIYHIMMENEGPEVILAARGWIAHCHVAENTSRAAPGIDPLRDGEQLPYYRNLQKIDYNGMVSIECRWTDVATELPMGITYLKKQFQ